MNDAKLLQRVRECCLDRLPNARKVIRPHEQDVIYAACLEVVKHLQPVFGRLCFAHVKPQNIPFALHIDANRYIDNLVTRTDLVADTVEIDDRPTG